MLTRTITAALIAATFSAVCFEAGQADDATRLKKARTHVRFHWQPADATVTISYYTGCRSAHGAPVLTDNIEAYLDRDYLQFDLQGGYQAIVPRETQETQGPRIGPADCMGSMAKVIEFLDVERETYVVNRHGELARTIALAGQEVEFIISDQTTAVGKPAKPAMFLTAE